MLKNYISKNKNIIIVGGTKAGRQNLLVEAVSLIDARERIAVIEKTPEMSEEKLLGDTFSGRNIISIQTSDLSLDKKPLNAIAVASVDALPYVVDRILPNSKYAILACDKLTDELEPYADVVVQLKDDDTLDSITESSN